MSENHPQHHIGYLHEGEMTVPVTAVRLHNSPQDVPNPDLLCYRTMGPGSDPRQGLEAFRHDWITERHDTDEIPGRARDLVDDGPEAIRRGAATQ